MLTSGGPKGRSVLISLLQAGVLKVLKCGEGGIRTPDAGITDVTVFETAAFNRSATSPLLSVSTHPPPFNYLLLPILLHSFVRLNLDLHLEENDGLTPASCRSCDVVIALRRQKCLHMGFISCLNCVE